MLSVVMLSVAMLVVVAPSNLNLLKRMFDKQSNYIYFLNDSSSFSNLFFQWKMLDALSWASINNLYEKTSATEKISAKRAQNIIENGQNFIKIAQKHWNFVLIECFQDGT
jgi:hypothetical protein